ncbi:MAG: ABC transporter permease, partial [Merismopedia sp. SIO2A8]|nr:ABC transporter permease [Merismopedia sp. SIO2A8]
MTTSTRDSSIRNRFINSWYLLTRLVTSETFLYILKRLLQAILTLFLASALSFAIIQLAPGDYLDTLRQNPQISPESIEELKQQFGLDQPGYIQYWRWLRQVVTEGNFGTSFVYFRSVSSLLAERIPATLLLAIASIILTWALAIPLGIIAAVNQNRWIDRFLQVISYTGQGFPSFIFAL